MLDTSAVLRVAFLEHDTLRTTAMAFELRALVEVEAAQEGHVFVEAWWCMTFCIQNLSPESVDGCKALEPPSLDTINKEWADCCACCKPTVPTC
jgi:hypothetical protein